MARQEKISPQLRPNLYSYGSNLLGAKNVFKEREKYDMAIMPDFIAPNMMQTWTTDRFYGLVNTQGNAVRVAPERLKPLRFKGGEDTLYALDFVADAWRDFAERLRSLADQGILFENSPWSKPLVQKAWTPLITQYDDYMLKTVYPTFRVDYMEVGTRDEKLTNVSTFMQLFNTFSQDVVLKVGPITMSGMIESSQASVLSSGLVIEVGLDDYDDDLTKAYKYGDRNFSLVGQIAAEYGFAIDKNIPWRLIADLSNPAMQEYMTGVPIVGFDLPDTPEIECDPLTRAPERAPMAYGYSQLPGKKDVLRHVSFFVATVDGVEKQIEGYSRFKKSVITPLDAGGHANIWGMSPIPNTVFSAFYALDFTETWHVDIDLLSAYLLIFYNTYVSGKPFITVQAPAVCSDPKSIFREGIDPDQYDILFGSRWKLKTFYLCRLAERGRNPSNQRKVTELQEAMNLYNISPSETSYISALEFLKTRYLGPYDTDPLTLGTVGDIIDQGRSSSVFSNS